MARPRTPAAETPPTAPPLVSKDSLPPDDTFRDYLSTAVMRIAGPFEPPIEVETREGKLAIDEAVFIALDPDGHPYPIAPEVLDATYAALAAEPGEHWQVGTPATFEGLDEIRKTAFEEGVTEGIRRATAKQLPLFEQAKQLARDHVDDDETRVGNLVADLEEERDERLSPSDRELVLALHRRLRAQQKQREAAAREPGVPRRTPPAAPAAPGRTEYKHII